jgi:predicted phage terminase large subunit-like protein
MFPSLTSVDAELARRSGERDRRAAEDSVEAVRQRCRSFHCFLREAWPVLEPGRAFVDGWAIKAICDHLEAISYGRFLSVGRPNRLRINLPPGLGKSLIVSVAYNAWHWGPAGFPQARFLSTSYMDDYVRRDTRRTRNLVMSEWYRKHWPHVELVRAAETSFENSAGGSREGAPFNALTGGRGDVLTIDDPLSVAQSRSSADREFARFIMRESVPSRVNDVASSAIVLIGHRLHRDDPSGVWEGLNVPHVALVLPMRCDAARRCATPIFSDTRSDGELLFPERFDETAVRRMEMEMGAAGTAAQFAQSPAAREGLMFKRHWFEGRMVLAAPAGTRFIRHWDLAATRGGDGAETAGVKLGRAKDGQFYVAHCVTTREGGAEVRRLIKLMAEQDGRDVEVSLPQDPGQAGRVQAQDMIAMLAGWNVSANPETGSKESRAQPFAAQCEGGNVYIVDGPWNETFLDQLCDFPAGKLKDLVDAVSGAFGRFVLGEQSSYDSDLNWVGAITDRTRMRMAPPRSGRVPVAALGLPSPGVD